MLNCCAFYLTDDFEEIRASMNNYVNTGHTKTPTWGRGHRQAKRNFKFLEDDVDGPVVVVSINSSHIYYLQEMTSMASPHGSMCLGVE